MLNKNDDTTPLEHRPVLFLVGPNTSTLRIPVYSGRESHHQKDDWQRGSSQEKRRCEYNEEKLTNPKIQGVPF